MSKWKTVAAALVVSAGAALVCVAQQAGSSSAAPAAEDASKLKLFEPYNLLNDLTPDQKTRIEDIHKTEMAAEKQLKDKEHDDIMALLSDPQKKELDDAMSKSSLERRASTAEKRAQAEEQKAKDLENKANGATTQP